MNKEEKKAMLAKYQNKNITTIWLMCVIAPIIIVIYLTYGNLEQLDFVNMVNLAFKSASLLITVFLPVILIDVIYYDSIEENNKDINIIKLLFFNKFSARSYIIFAILAFYSMLIFGNIRSWIREIYGTEVYDIILNRIYNVEICFKWIGIVSFIISFSLMIYNRRVSATEKANIADSKIVTSDVRVQGGDKKKKSNYFWVILTVILAPILVNVLLIIPSPKIFSVNNDNAWIGFFGNYSGGIIGGIVAFLIVGIQIKNQKENSEKEIRDIKIKEKNLMKYSQLPSLVKLKFLLEGIDNSLEAVSHLINSGIVHIKGRKFTALDKIPFEVYSMNSNYLEAIEKIIDVNLQIDLIKLTDFYFEFHKRKIIDNRKNEIQLAMTQTEINMKSCVLDKTDAMKYEIKMLKLKSEDILAEKDINETLWLSIWNKFNDDGYLEKTKLLLKNIEEEIEEIQKILL